MLIVIYFQKKESKFVFKILMYNRIIELFQLHFH